MQAKAFVLVLAGIALGSCGMEPVGSSSRPGKNSQLRGIDRDLGPGDRGDDVRAVQEYLARFGYSPNEKLARTYPRWRPIVPSSPVEMGVYDASTAAAVRAYQHNMGLDETGRVERSTLAMMLVPRCGVPDGIVSFDARDKFSLLPNKWTITSLTWWLNDNIPSTSVTQARAAIYRATGKWEEKTNLVFSEKDPGPANITIVSGPVGGGLGSSTPPDGNNGPITITLDDGTPFTGPDHIDLDSLLEHELGHAIGLNHSAYLLAVMMPGLAALEQRRLLTIDDTTAVGALYNPWQKLPGCGKDIAISPDGEPWSIGCTPTDGSFNVQKWNPATSSWSPSNGAGVRITADIDGFPWVSDSFGRVFKKNTTSAAGGSWGNALPGCARDIAAGPEGSVWKTGCENVPGGSYIYKWNGSDWTRTNDIGAAVSISVDGYGRPWLVNVDGNVYARSTNSTATGIWYDLPTVPGGALDIAVLSSSPLNFATTASIADGARNAYVWDQQPQCSNGAPPPCPLPMSAPADPKLEWIRDAAAACGSTRIVRVALGLDGPWVVTENGDICHKSR